MSKMFKIKEYKMPKKYLFIIGIIVIALIVTVVVLRGCKDDKYPPNMTPAQKVQFKKLRKGHEKLIRRSKSGKFSIEGKIVDKKGNLLNNVRVSITKSISRGFMGNKHTNRKEIVDAKFSFNESGCNVLHLQFLKQGYYAANKSYNIIMKQEKNIYVKDSLLTAKKQIVVLREIGKLVKLKSRYSKFYMDPISKEQDIMDLISFNKIKIKKPKNIKTPKYFYLSVKLDKRGKPEMVLSKDKRLIPAGIFLNYVSNDETDRIAPVGNAEIKDMRDMPLAPEKGYSLKQISLKFSRPGDFFYYKNGDTYGKVWVRQTDFLLGKVESVIVVKQNNEKDSKERRNLRSLDY
jgi:hypothetical protein